MGGDLGVGGWCGVMGGVGGCGVVIWGGGLLQIVSGGVQDSLKLTTNLKLHPFDARQKCHSQAVIY